MAERVSAKLNLAHISTGDMLREQIKQGTELGALAKSYIDKGELVPDQVIIDMMNERFKKDDAKHGVLLDGFPRTVAQAEALEKIAKIDACINLVIDLELVVDRIISRRVCDKCGAVYSIKTYASTTCNQCEGGKLITRADDNEATVRERSRVYEEQTAPLIEYYGSKGILTDVDATLPIEQEAALICEILGGK